jgi:hypothetical protein
VNEEPHPRKMTSQHLTPDKRQWAHKRITRDTRNWSAQLTGPEASWRTVRQEPSASNIPLSHNLSNYSNNLESILDVYDVGHLGYNTWFFKRTYKNDHVNQFDPNDQENPIFSRTRHTTF